MGNKASRKGGAAKTGVQTAEGPNETNRSQGPMSTSDVSKREKQARELGLVNWLRAGDFDKALKLSAEEKKPVFLIFQGVYMQCATLVYSQMT